MSSDYVMKEWKGKPMWQCTRCRWNTLKGIEAMEAHVRTQHRRVVTLPLVDHRGQQIQRVEVIGDNAHGADGAGNKE